MSSPADVLVHSTAPAVRLPFPSPKVQPVQAVVVDRSEERPRHFAHHLKKIKTQEHRDGMSMAASSSRSSIKRRKCKKTLGGGGRGQYQREVTDGERTTSNDNEKTRCIAPHLKKHTNTHTQSAGSAANGMQQAAANGDDVEGVGLGGEGAVEVNQSYAGRTSLMPYSTAFTPAKPEQRAIRVFTDRTSNGGGRWRVTRSWC